MKNLLNYIFEKLNVNKLNIKLYTIETDDRIYEITIPFYFEITNKAKNINELVKIVNIEKTQNIWNETAYDFYTTNKKGEKLKVVTLAKSAIKHSFFLRNKESTPYIYYGSDGKVIDSNAHIRIHDHNYVTITNK